MEAESGVGAEQSHALLTSPVRRRILEVLESVEPRDPSRLGAEGLTAGQLATQLSLHVTTVRFHLDQLVAAGLVETSFHKHVGAGRPRKVYARVAQPRPQVSSQESLRLLTALLTEAFVAQGAEGAPLSPEEAGRRWAEEHVPAEAGEPAVTAGQWIAKLGRTIDVLADWGYEPELAADGASRDARIELTHCPFRDLARANTDVVCGIHRGLIAGTMSRLGEPDTEVDLIPFADGDRCIARIHATATPGGAAAEIVPNPPAPNRTTTAPATTKETR
ncbi:helix-turn-helix domain-containing protein [Nostocoides sp. F2B08]|nr:helix-turn-helix domain-containing protein [Tetrasphaera sp. F2B08]